jgi:hypothetical protein
MSECIQRAATVCPVKRDMVPVRVRVMALRMVSSLRMEATRATFRCFPRATSWSWKAEIDRLPSRRQERHVEHRPHIGASSPDRPSTSQGPAVAAEWRDADQAGNLASGNSTEFRHEGDKGARDDFAHPRALRGAALLSPAT